MNLAKFDFYRADLEQLVKYFLQDGKYFLANFLCLDGFFFLLFLIQFVSVSFNFKLEGLCMIFWLFLFCILPI